MTLALAQDVDPRLVDACGIDRTYLCEKVWEWTDSELMATAADWIIDRPIRIVFLLVLAWVVSKVAQRSVLRFSRGIASNPAHARLRSLRERGPGRMLIDARESTRAVARAETIGHVLRSVVVAVVWTFAAMLILGELDINMGPLIAGAGIGGIALGFGAQSIVKDFLSGLFMLIEDQYGVGDIIDVGEASGVVEEVSLRSTTLRDVYGTVWHVPNGEIARVGNKSQLWSRALIDIEVAYDTDLRMAMGVVQRVADEMWADPDWGRDELIEQPEVWGIQSLGASGIAIRLVIKTEPSEQWGVERELRLRLKEAFDAAGIEIPFPQQTMWVRSQGDFPVPAPPEPGSVATHDVVRSGGDEASGAEGVVR
jgi:small conductance mechanosensitive channel